MNIRRISTVLLLSSLALVPLGVAGCGDEVDDAVDQVTSAVDEGIDTVTSEAGDALRDDETSVTLDTQNDSGQAGAATLTRIDDTSTRVVVELDNAPGDPQPAHIHNGTCATLDPAPRYPLENLVDGKSTSTVRVALETLRDQDFAINVHRSTDQLDVYVACGNIGG